MQVAEAAGTAASLALGAGVVLTAVKQGGKWAVVKTVAKVAASGAAAYGTGKAVEHGLRAAGADEETIHGVRLAAEVVTWLLLLRHVGSARAKPAPREPAAIPVTFDSSIHFPGRFARVNPNDIRFSQTTVGGQGRAAHLRESMKHGWNGPAVDAVETPEGLVTIDNTRVAIARELGISEVPVKVRLPSDALPSSMLGRFGNAKTWGEALQLRTARQRPPLPTSGTLDSPRIPQ